MLTRNEANSMAYNVDHGKDQGKLINMLRFVETVVVAMSLTRSYTKASSKGTARDRPYSERTASLQARLRRLAY